MVNELGIAKQKLKRIRGHCRSMAGHLEWLYDQYENDHKPFANRVFTAAQNVRMFDEFIESIFRELMDL